jgi:hypothetical protein
MAKNPKKITSLGILPEDFNETRLRSNDVHEHEHTHTHEHEPVARVKKDRRVQWLTYDSLILRIDAYAQERGVSRADALEAMAEKFLSDLGR